MLLWFVIALSFDGTWTGTDSNPGHCWPFVEVKVTITDGVAAGTAEAKSTGPHGTTISYPISGHVDAEGSFTGEIARDKLTGTASGGQMKLKFSSTCGKDRELNLKRST